MMSVFVSHVMFDCDLVEKSNVLHITAVSVVPQHALLWKSTQKHVWPLLEWMDNAVKVDVTFTTFFPPILRGQSTWNNEPSVPWISVLKTCHLSVKNKRVCDVYMKPDIVLGEQVAIQEIVYGYIVIEHSFSRVVYMYDCVLFTVYVPIDAHCASADSKVCLYSFLNSPWPKLHFLFWKSKLSLLLRKLLQFKVVEV